MLLPFRLISFFFALMRTSQRILKWINCTIWFEYLSFSSILWVNSFHACLQWSYTLYFIKQNSRMHRFIGLYFKKEKKNNFDFNQSLRCSIMKKMVHFSMIFKNSKLSPANYATFLSFRQFIHALACNDRLFSIHFSKIHFHHCLLFHFYLHLLKKREVLAHSFGSVNRCRERETKAVIYIIHIL